MGKIRDYPDISYNIRVWTAAILAWLERQTGRKPVFFDIGAHLGEFTMAFSSSCAGLHAFEPVPETMERLRGLAGSVSGVSFHPIALSDAPGTLTLHRFSDPSFNSLYDRTDDELAHYGITRAGTVAVRVARLDDYVGEIGLARPDFVKIDIEGAELPALRGAAGTIAAARPCILCEYSVDNTQNAGYPREHIEQWLRDHDYLVRGLYRDRDLDLHADLSPRGIWNILAVPREHSEALNPGLVSQPR